MRPEVGPGYGPLRSGLGRCPALCWHSNEALRARGELADTTRDASSCSGRAQSDNDESAGREIAQELVRDVRVAGADEKRREPAIP